MKRWRRRLFVVLSLFNLVVAPVTASAGGIDDNTAYEIYANSSYSYCDAQVLADMWQISAYDAKITIGYKLDWGNESLLNEELFTAKEKSMENLESTGPCYFWEAGYTYDDADVLASAWGITTWDAKLVIESKLMYFGKEYVDEMIVSASGMGDGHSVDADPTEVFFANGYSYCDAEVVGLAWGMDTFDTKLELGHKLINYGSDYVSGVVESARFSALESNHACYYWEAGYTYEDAEAIAAMWGTDTWEVKVWMDSKLAYGDTTSINDQIAMAMGRDH